MATNALPSVEPTVPDWLLPVETAIEAAGPAVPVAVNGTVCPFTVAFTVVVVPAAVPRVSLLEARPLESVIELSVESDPPPLMIVQLTATPGTTFA
jgi:hypothetical protein